MASDKNNVRPLADLCRDPCRLVRQVKQFGS